MLKLPNTDHDTLSRLMSDRILALTEFHMRKDGALVEGEEIALFPENVSYEKANYEFQSLRKLLRHPDAFTPELMGEYLMYSLIQIAIDLDEDPDPNPCLHLASARFPEPERAALVKELGKKEVERYEDLRNYEDTVFYDEDYLMLEDMSETDLLTAPGSEELGIGPVNGQVIDLDGRKAVLTMRPWENPDSSS